MGSARDSQADFVTWDDAWFARAADLDAETARHLLAEADAVRGAGGRDVGHAVAIYAGLLPHQAPPNALHVERLSWALNALRHFDEHSVALCEHAESPALPAHVHTEARMFRGTLLAMSGDSLAAGEVFREALDAARGTGTRAEVSACLNLGVTYSHRGCYFEALVLYHHAVQLCRGSGFFRAEIYALTNYSRLLMDLGELDEAAAAIQQLEAAIERRESADSLAPWEYDTLDHRRVLLRQRSELMSAVGRPQETLELLDALGGTPADSPTLADERVLLTGLRVQALLALGRVGEAAQHVSTLRTYVKGSSYDWFTVQSLDIALADARADADAVAELASGLLAELEVHGFETVGAGTVRRRATEVASALARHGLAAQARRALDLAASAILQRMREVDRCIAEVPELMVPSEQADVVLQRVRERFARENAELRSRVTGLVQLAIEHGDAWVRDLLDLGKEMPVQCAWCGLVRGHDRNWLPVGHFLLASDEMRLTHGICERCFAGVRLASQPGEPTGVE